MILTNSQARSLSVLLVEAASHTPSGMDIDVNALFAESVDIESPFFKARVFEDGSAYINHQGRISHRTWAEMQA